MRRPLWQSHIVAAALSVGCGAAPSAGAAQTAAVSTEERGPEAQDAAPAEDGAIEQTERADRDTSAEQPECAGKDCDSPRVSGERRNRKRPRRERPRRVAKNAGDERERGRENEAAAAPSGAESVAQAPPVTGELVDRLFFARGSARLDEHGQALDAIAKVVRAGEPVTIIIIGGADEREPPGLARERAHAVRDALQARGVPASWIVIGLGQPSSGPPSYDQKVEIRLQRP